MVVGHDGLLTRNFPALARRIQIHTSEKAGPLFVQGTLRVS
jgi:hypothetical protein